MKISAFISLLLACICASASAFTLPTTQSGAIRSKSFALGPVAGNGIEWDEIVMGQGRRILPGDTVLCYYVGSFTSNDGGFFSKDKQVVFDQTDEDQPFQFVVGKGNVIKGWDVGILGDLDGDIIPMKVGGKRRLNIPSKLAYGANGVGPIPANQDLSFDLEVVLEAKHTGYCMMIV
ncbi:FK506-binding protein 4 [Seminavis robusta]|uniref:peptidylprolyl isomerase n=1 Tax=Seminavis robusta TaxID=568900 RepID=A0A9N8HXN6_9STRA|nr:FK506-binding protein 4 [Seminavis robusta]|eukprot:Sro2520_g330140.1 FK506-binding protein 4 (177) ;mRNA; r:100-847